MRRAELRTRWLDDDRVEKPAAFTGGVGHLALICLGVDKTITF